jgi:hypothetical protein
MLAGGDPDRAGGLVAQLAQGRELGVDLLEPGADRAEQALAGLGWRHAAGGAAEQAQAQPLLQPTHGVTQGRLRHAELGGGTGEAALAGHGQEGQEVAQILARHP